MWISSERLLVHGIAKLRKCNEDHS